jgi:hypothetical protein
MPVAAVPVTACALPCNRGNPQTPRLGLMSLDLRLSLDLDLDLSLHPDLTLWALRPPTTPHERTGC